MELYLIRHADAVPLAQGDVNADEDRPLSPRGEQETRALAVALKARGVSLEMLLSSPLLRARQTAQGVADRWPAPAPEVRLCDDLAPGGRMRRLARTLRKMPAASIALVGHMPDLALLAAWLIGSKKAQIPFAKAGVAYISCAEAPDKGSGQLLWLVTPEWFPPLAD